MATLTYSVNYPNGAPGYNSPISPTGSAPTDATSYPATFTTLTAGINNYSTTIPVVSTTGYASSGKLCVYTTDGNLMVFSYGGTTSTSFTSCTFYSLSGPAGSGSVANGSNVFAGFTVAGAGTLADTNYSVSQWAVYSYSATNSPLNFGVFASGSIAPYYGFAFAGYTGYATAVWGVKGNVGFAYPLHSGKFDDTPEVNAYVYNSQTTSSSSSNAIVPPSGGYPVSIAGRNYMVDTSFEPYRREAFRHKSLQPQRQSLHFTNMPDDGTVSTEGLWRREARDWSLGSGQIYFDRKASTDNRYAHSKGVNPWTQWQLTLLNDVTIRYTATNTVKAIRCGSYVYYADGNSVYFRTSWSGSATTVAGLSGTVLDICSDGYYVYIVTTLGVWQTAQGATGSATQIVKSSSASGSGSSYPWTASISGKPLTAIIAYVGGRLILAMSNMAVWAASGTTAGANLFDLSSHTSGNALSASAPEYFYHNPVPSWTWTGIAHATSCIYFSGHSSADDGSMASVFRSSVSQATSTGGTTNITLDSPVVALPMPAGEYPTSMRGYLNYIFVGTNKGIRMCQSLNQYDPSGVAGDLKSGPLIPNVTEKVSQPVTAIVGNDRYLYFAWNNYDFESTGLGRLDLTTFIDVLAPAYASDLMVNGQGTTGACTWLDWDSVTNSPMMSMNTVLLSGNSSTGNYIYTANPNSTVHYGTVDSGFITYGIPDNKNVMRLDFNVQNVVAANSNSGVSFQLYTDNNAGLPISQYSNTTPKSSVDFPQQFGEQYRLVTTLVGAYDGTNYYGPSINRWTLKGLPGIPSGIMISAVLNFYEPYEMEGSAIWSDPYQEYAFLEALRQSQQVVTYVEGPYTAQVTIDMLDWLPERRRDVRIGGYFGDIVVYMKTLTG